MRYEIPGVGMAITVITQVHVFDGSSPDVLRDRTLIIEDARIKDIASSSPATSVDRIIDGGGRFAIPGLIDAHFHCCLSTLDLPALDRMPMSLLAQHARRILEAALQRGFTSIRDAGGADHGIASAVEHGLIDGPRVFFSGRALSQTGGHGDLRDPHHVEPCACAYRGRISRVVDGEDAVRLAVREELRRGAHQIKLMVSGGVLSPADPIWMNQFSDAEIRAAVEEAGTRRCYVMAHAHTAGAALRCAALGVRSIEHGTLIDPVTASRLADSDCFVVPTLVTMDALLRSEQGRRLPAAAHAKLEGLLDSGLAALKACHRAGVRLGFGTDLLGELHVRQSGEFALRAAVQEPVDILRSATSVNAAMMGLEGEIGTLAPGAHADLLLLDGDPLQDISVLTRPEATLALIMKGGVIFRNAL